MRICIRIGGVEHCFFIPIYFYPFKPIKVGPGPVNYPALFSDASIVGTIDAAARNISDGKVRSALESGVKSAIQALKARGGEHVSNVSIEE